MRSKLLRSLAASFSIFSLVLLPISQMGTSLQPAHASDDLWQDYENYTVIDHDMTWSGQITRADIPKPVVVVNGATLTIEKGTRIELGSLTVYDGKIIALGTEKEKIVFTKQAPDLSWLPPEFLDYDKECFLDVDGMIEFADVVETDAEGASFVRYAELDGMGTYFQRDVSRCPVAMKEDQHSFAFLLNTAYAAEETVYGPALKFRSGKLHIENSSFKNNAYADIETSMDFSDEWDSYDSLQVINSNFEGNTQNTALISNFNYDGVQDHSHRVFLKNNWYGSAGGPKMAPDYILGGERFVGKYVLDGFRKKNLIADPLIIIPGITGSAQVLGTWKLDPITHSYDDLIASLKRNGYEVGINLFEFPYDWRKNNATSAHYLQGMAESVLGSTKVSKADIVAHSMGALVARAYIEEVGGALYEDTVDQLITLGTPNDGSPEAYLKWEAGEGFFRLDGILAKHHFEQEAEHAGYDDNLKGYIQDKIISVKELLPDYKYLLDVSTGSVRDYPSGYPQNEFLEELNSDQNKDELAAINYTNIVGLVSPERTISRIRVQESMVSGKWEHGMPENFYNVETDRGLEYGRGDETVPESSAKGAAADTVIEVTATHNELPTKAQCEVFRELTGIQECSYADNWNIPNILLFNVFSPIDIQIISPSGKKMGKNFETGGIYDGIPGAYYTGHDTENEFITIPNPEDGEYRILTQGTGEGEYRIEATEITEGANPGDEAKESVATLTGTATTGATEEKKIELLADDTVISKEDNDIIAPTIIISSPENKSYLNNQLLPITSSVTDNISTEANIQKVLTLDGNSLTQASIDLSLQSLGNHTLALRATDEADNDATQAVTFENTVTFDSLRKNIDHYFSLGLIKKKKEVRHIREFLRYLETVQGLIDRLEQMRYFPPRTKEQLLRHFHRELDHMKGEFIEYLSKRTAKGVIAPLAKDRIVEAVGTLVQ